MKTNGLFLIIVLFLTSSTLKSQEERIFYHPDVHTAFTVADIKMQGDNLNVYFINQAVATSLKTREVGRTGISLVGGHEKKSYNALTLFTVDREGSIKSVNRDLYTPNGDSIYFVVDDFSEKAYSSYSFKHIQEKYQDLFNKEPKYRYFYVTERFGVRKHIQKLDDYNLFYIPDENISFPLQPQHDQYRYTSEIPFLIDRVNHYITAAFGKYTRDIRNNQFKDIDFFTYDQPDNISNSFNVEFEYPRVLESQHLVYSIDNNEPVGKLFVFVYRTGIGRRHNDPERNNAEIVFCNVEGEKIFHTTVKLTDDSRGRVSVHGAFSDGKDIYLHINAHEDNEVFGIVKFDYNGEYDRFYSPKSLLTNNMETINGDISKKLNLSRSPLPGYYGRPGCHWGINTDFWLRGVKQTETHLLVWGQMSYRVDDPDYKPPTSTDGRSTMSTGAPKVNLYGEIVFFSYDLSTMEFEKAYLQELPLTKASSNPVIIYGSDSKTGFIIPVVEVPVPELYKKARYMADKNGNRHVDYPHAYMYNALYVSLDEQDASHILFNDLVLFDLDKSICRKEDSSGSYVVGFQKDLDDIFYLNVKYLGL